MCCAATSIFFQLYLYPAIHISFLQVFIGQWSPSSSMALHHCNAFWWCCQHYGRLVSMLLTGHYKMLLRLFLFSKFWHVLRWTKFIKLGHKFGAADQENLAAQKHHFCTHFGKLHNMIANISKMQQDNIKWKMALQTATSAARAYSIWWILVHKWQNQDHWFDQLNSKCLSKPVPTFFFVSGQAYAPDHFSL